MESSGDGPPALVDTASPYANTRLKVRYVGDSACTQCHGKIAETYRRHPMGRSLSPIAGATAGGDEEDSRPLFEAQGLEYSIEHRDGRVLHQETRRDSAGQIVARNEAEVQFVLGSGRQGVRLPDRTRRLSLPVPDQLVCPEAAVGSLSRL